MSAEAMNWLAALSFILAWTTACISFFVVAGMYPLAARPPATKHPGGAVLVIVNSALLVVLIAGSLVFGLAALRWTIVAVIAGLGFLFAPSVFEVWPEPLRDSRLGLALLAFAQAMVLAALAAAT